MLDTKEIPQDFPVLKQEREGKPPIYLDSACMSLKPQQVINALTEYYSEFSACAERSDHWFATIVDEKVTTTREKAASFIGANKKDEIVLTYNTTHGINIIANQFRTNNEKGLVIISDKEHNSNFLPWKELADQGKIDLEIVPTNNDNQIEMEVYEEAIEGQVNRGGMKLVSLVYTSNLDGVTFPLPTLFEHAKENGFLTHADAAQYIPHNELDVNHLKADFVTFSGHKILGPTATGVLWGKYDLLEQLPPFIVGGGTPFDLTYEQTTYQKPPMKFEAGLQHYAGIIGLGAAIDYLDSLYKEYGTDAIAQHETELNTYLTEGLLNLSDRIKLIGPTDPTLRSGIVSFIVDGIDHHQVSYLLNDQSNIMVRAGRHCVHGYCNSRNISGTVRASLYIYNTKEECDIFLETMEKVVKL